MVHSENYNTKSEAAKREKEIKGWSRKKKLALLKISPKGTRYVGRDNKKAPLLGLFLLAPPRRFELRTNRLQGLLIFLKGLDYLFTPEAYRRLKGVLT